MRNVTTIVSDERATKRESNYESVTLSEQCDERAVCAKLHCVPSAQVCMQNKSIIDYHLIMLLIFRLKARKTTLCKKITNSAANEASVASKYINNRIYII